MLRIAVLLLMAACKPSNKRTRIARLSGIGGVSDNALLAILAEIREDRSLLDDAASRATIYREVSRAFDGVTSRLVLPLKDGKTFIWHVASLRLLLPWLCERCPIFGQALGALPTTWSSILYVDEFTPGDPLHPLTCRKTAGFYFSIKEFGPAKLSSTCAWVPIAVLRHEIIAEVDGGHSAVLRKLLEDMFVGPHGISTAGIAFLFGGVPSLRFVNSKYLVGDEEYISLAWGIMGSGGMLCCLKCSNVTSHRSSIPDPDFVSIACGDTKEFRRRTDAEAWATHEMLASKSTTMKKTPFGKVQTCCGFKYHPNSILASHALMAFLSPVSMTLYDSMHCAFANGVAGLGIKHFLKSIEEEYDFEWDDLRLVADCGWRQPNSRTHRDVAHLFNPVREESTSNSTGYRATASEMLTIYPLVRFFAIKSFADTPGIGKFSSLRDTPPTHQSVASLLDRRAVGLLESGVAGSLDRSLAREGTKKSCADHFGTGCIENGRNDAEL